MENKKKIIIIAVTIFLVILITLLTIKLIKIEKNKGKEVINLNKNAIENNTVENNVQNENIKDKNNENVNEENNNQTNTIQNTASNAGEEVTKTEIEKEETDKEKALNLVKKDWGEDDNVYFTVESIDGNGNYTIYVREGETTREISVYTVNLKTGKFTKE